MERVMRPLQEVGALIWHCTETANLPTPLVSIQVSTDGQDFPPLYLDRNFMAEVERMKAELDLDIISCL